MQQIQINQLKPHPRNNEFFDDIVGDKWQDFLQSIKTSGVIEPIVITQDSVIVSGHQRVRACKELGIDTVTCEVKIYQDDDEILYDMLNSNSYRIKEIPSLAKRICIVNKLYEIIENKNKIIKQDRNNVVKELRKELAKQRDEILLLHNNKCDVCNFDFTPILQIHHILPLQQGGNNSLSNLMCLCPNCHQIIHRYISNFRNHADDNEMSKWLEQHYTTFSYSVLIQTYGKYIHKLTKYGWDEI